MEQRSDEWFVSQLRKDIASRIPGVMMKRATAGCQNCMSQLVCERLTGVATEGFTSSAMQHGINTEPRARALCEIQAAQDVLEVGLVEHPHIAMSGAGPDSLVKTDGLLEIKRPRAAEHIRILMGGDIKKSYHLQMQWGDEPRIRWSEEAVQ